MMNDWSKEPINRTERYSRQMLLPEIGPDGQKLLMDSKVLVIGLGALGGHIANNLARAGIGHIKLVDRDVIELNNLQRQILYDEDDVGRSKVMVAAEKLKKINSDIRIDAYLRDLNFSNAELMIKGTDVVVDGTDNMETRFLINDVCVKNEIPWIYAGAIGTQGMTMTIIPHDSPCLKCIIPGIPPAGSLGTCDTAGILNSVTSIVAAVESAEVIKLLLDSKNINDGLFMIDAWTHSWEKVNVSRKNDCRCCVEHDFEFLNVKKRTMVTALCGKDVVQISPIKRSDISLDELGAKLGKVGEVEYREFALVFKLPGFEITIFKDGRATINGTSDEKTAKSLYSKYLGM